MGQTIIVFIQGLPQMGVAGAVMLVGQIHGLGHQLLGHGKGRARGESHLQHRAFRLIVVLVQHPLAVGQDGVVILNDRVRGQTTILLRQAHRAAVERHADAEPCGFLYLDVHRIFQTRRIEIVVVRNGGTAAHQQFG